MTWATSEGLSELRHPRLCTMRSSDGVHERAGFAFFDAEIRASLIRAAISLAGLIS